MDGSSICQISLSILFFDAGKGKSSQVGRVIDALLFAVELHSSETISPLILSRKCTD